MIQQETRLEVADNTGAKQLLCIRVMGSSNKKFANLIGKITDSDGNVIKEFTPDVANKADSVSDATWTTVQNGMARVISEGAISMLTNRLPVKVCGKSGTAQEDKKRGNHACYVMFSQNDEGVATAAEYGHDSFRMIVS